MTEQNAPAARPDHAAHDATWMAALAARDPDLSAAEMARAQEALKACGACADLFADLVAMSAAIPTAAVPTRPRDYTLTAADAARLRPRGLRRWVAGIGSVRDGVTFPLAMGLTTMGIAGLLIATIPAAFSGATAGAAPQVLSTVGNAIPAPAPSAAAAASAAAAPAALSAAPAASAAPSAESAAEGTGYSDTSAAPTSETTGGGEVFSGDDGDEATQRLRQDANEMTSDAAFRDDGTGVSALMIVAATLLLAGLGLFVLRWSARRL